MAGARPSRQYGRIRILDAARTAFGQYGYNATTTRLIAQRAGISEPMIFRYFGSKEGLFDAAVLTPFTEFLSRRAADWEQRKPGSAPALDEAERLFDHLIGLFLEERSIVMALLAVYHFDDATAALKNRLEASMRDVVALVEGRAVGEATARGNIGFDVPALARIMVGMCFSLVTFPRLFATDGFPRARLVREMARMTMYGVESRNWPLKGSLAATPHLPAEKLSEKKALSGEIDIDPSFGNRLPHRVDDDTWELIARILRANRIPSRRGRRPIDDRAALEGIIEVLASGRPWRDLPSTRYGVSGITCWRRLKAWQQQGAWPAVLDTLQSAAANLTDGRAKDAFEAVGKGG
jgi:AcrR family transcriptional regulator/transposase